MPVDAGGGGGARRPATAPPPPPAAVWWFQGKAYFSLAAYQAAVAAANNAAQAARAQEAKRVAEQRAIQQQQAARVRASQQAAAATAARAALERSRLAAQTAAKQRAEQLRIQQIQAERVRAQKALLNQREADARAAAQLRTEQALMRERRDAVLKEQRRQAYDELQRQEHRAYMTLDQRRAMAANSARSGAASSLIRESGPQITTSPRGLVAGVDMVGPREVFDRKGTQQARVDNLLSEAETTGDYTSVLQTLDQQSSSTGGRYIDPRLMEAVNRQVISPVVRVGGRYTWLVQRLNHYFELGDDEGWQRLYESPMFQRVYEEYVRWFGDPDVEGDRGAFAPYVDVLDRIADRQERLWLTGSLNLPANASDQIIAQTLEAAYSSAPRDVRGGFAEFADGRNPRMDLYAQMLEDKDRRRVEKLKADFRRDLKLYRQEGYTNVKFENGMVSYDNPEDLRVADRVKELLPEASSRLAAMESMRYLNPAKYEELVRDFMRDLGQAYSDDAARSGDFVAPETYSRYMGRGKGPTPFTAAPTPTSRLRLEFLDRAAQVLLGRGWNGLDDLSTSFVGVPISSALTVFSIAPAAVRYIAQGAQMAQQGTAYQPYIDIHLFGDKGFGWEWGRVADENAAESRRMLEVAMQTGDIGTIAEALRQHSQWGEGNIGGLFTQLVDPLQFVGLGGVTSRIKLATALAGGYRSALRHPGLLLDELYMLSKPRLAGGLGSDIVRLEFSRMKIAQGLGISYKTVRSSGDKAWRDLAEAFLEGKQNLKISDDLAKILDKSPLKGKALMSQAQKVVREVSREYGLLPGDALEMNRMLRAIEEGAADAARQADAAKALAARAVEEAESLRALQAVRAASSQAKVLIERQANAAAQKAYSEAVQQVLRGSEEYLRVSTRAQTLVTEIRKVGTAESVDHFRLGTLQREVRKAVGQIREFQDQFKISPGLGKERVKEGLMTRYMENLRSVGTQYGWRPSAITADDVVKRGWETLRSDRQMVSSRIRGLQRALRSENNPAQIKILESRLAEAQKAWRGLDYEQSLLDGGRRMVKQAARKYTKEIKRGVRPQSLGAVVSNNSQRAIETVRSLNNRIGRVSRVEAPRNLTKKVRAAADTAIPALHGENVADLLRSFGVNFGDNVSMYEAIVALEAVMRDPLLRLEFAEVWQALKARAWNVMLANGWRTGLGKFERFVEILTEEYSRKGAKALDLAEFGQADRAVYKSLRDLRGWQAEGQIRRGRINRKYNPETRLTRMDTDPVVRLTKMRALRDLGIDMYQYDAARGVLGDVLVQRRAMAGMLWEARKEARRTGELLDDAYKRIRAARAEKEAQREFVEFAMRPDMRGATPEQVLMMFEEDYIGRDLGFTQELVVSRYQYETMQRAFLKQSGFRYGDQNQIRRYFLGLDDTLPPGARRPNADDGYMVFEGMNQQVYVVAKDHYNLIDPPDWARSRMDDIGRELDPDEVAQVEQISKSSDVTVTDTKAKMSAGSTRPSAPKMFAGPHRATPEAYRAWLWEQIQHDSLFRRELTDLYFRKNGADWRALGGTVKDDTLAKASKWMATDPAAKAQFRRHGLGLEAPKTGFAARDALSQAKREVAALERAVSNARQIGGLRFRIPVSRKYIDDLKVALETAYEEAKKNKGAVEAARLQRAIRGDLRQVLGGQVDETAGATGLLKKGASGAMVDVGELSKIRALVDDLGLDSIDDLIRKAGRSSEWKLPEGFSWDSLEGRRIRGYETRLKAARARAKAAADDLAAEEAAEKAARGSVKRRYRARLGVSITSEGVFVREGTSNVTLAHELFHQFWDDAANEIWVADIQRALKIVGDPLQKDLWDAMRVFKGEAFDEAELTAELYALFTVGESAGSDVLYSWSDLLRLMESKGHDVQSLRSLGSTFEQWHPKVTGFVPPDNLRFPPIHNRKLLHDWLVENGYWSPRTGEAIARGERVWSLVEERQFFERNWGFTPEWTDEVVLKPLLNDPEALRAAMKEWGYADNGFERLVSEETLKPREVQKALAWGAEGIERQRTWDEMRRYVIERYGELVSSDGVSLQRMPWLMSADDEYRTWLKTHLTAADEWMAARDRLPNNIRDAYFTDGGAIKRGGIELDRGLLKEVEIDRFNNALVKATRRRFDRLLKAGKLDSAPRADLPPLQPGGRWAKSSEFERLGGQAPVQIVPKDSPVLRVSYPGHPRGLVASGLFDRKTGVIYVEKGAKLKTVYHEIGHSIAGHNRLAMDSAKSALNGTALRGTSDLRAEMAEVLWLGHGAHIEAEEIIVDLWARSQTEGWEAILKRAPEEIRLRFEEARPFIDSFSLPEARGAFNPREWLAQEQMQFAYEVVNELLGDQAWRSLLSGTPVAGAALHVWGSLWRALVSWTVAFPLMNILETYGLKRLYLQVYENGFRPLGWDRDGAALVQSLRDVGLESTSVFHLGQGPQTLTDVFSRVGDNSLSLSYRTRVLAGTFAPGGRLPVLISKWGEDRLRLQFAQSIAGRTLRANLKAGVGREAAEALARAEAKRVGSIFFATAPSSGLFKALDQLVPFFSYNVRNKTLALRMIVEHPSVFAWGERIKQDITRQNRETWKEKFGNLPFPDQPSSGYLWFDIDGETYKVDLSAFSDWSRAIANLTESQSVPDWVTEFLRIPHPSQAGAYAWLTGGTTPWGKPGDLRELSQWIDLIQWARGVDYANPDDRRDGVQMLSQILFFKKFGKIDPIKIAQMTYFYIKERNPEYAKQWLEHHPELLAYWQEKGSGGLDPAEGISRYAVLSDAERAAVDAARADFETLNVNLDRDIAKYATQPWSQGYKDAKKRAFDIRSFFLNQHPELTDYWAIYMSASDFANIAMRWKTDAEIEEFFSFKAPNKASYDDDLSFQKALVEYYNMREEWLKAHPAAMRALYGGNNAVVRAWRDQELLWSEMLEASARAKVRIIEEQAKPEPDEDFISLLYDVKDHFSNVLDGERYIVFDEALQRPSDKSLFRRIGEVPGFRDFRYSRASVEGKAQIEADERYGRAIKDAAKRASDGKEFYDILRSYGQWALDEYWKRNPDAKARYDAGQAYYHAISPWGKALEANNFVLAQKIWDSLPAWVKERYFLKHPDSKMRDGAGGSTAVQYDGKWFKSAASRDRYIQFVKGGGQASAFPDGFASAPGFSSPQARLRFVQGQAYYAALGTWIELLKAKEFAKADDYFNSLPDWMREKYYEKHPDQRAQHELDASVLRAGADYFLAQGDDKLRVLAANPTLREWLAKNGGDEARQRGLILAIYREIPAKEPWLRRTFRERYPEIFGQEAAGQRRLAGVARDLAEHPEVYPFYLKAIKLQSALFMEQLKRNKALPNPWTMERTTRLRKRRKRRAARLHSLWSLHSRLRHQK